MPVYYFDNFRGFHKTFLPIKDVNFFVGENSTGKTSVLNLVRILCDTDFWLGFNLVGDAQLDLGFFSEIADSTSSESPTFEIGYYDLDFAAKSRVRAIVLKFSEKKGQAVVSEIRVIYNHVNIEIRLGSKALSYRFSELATDLLLDSTFFEKWVIDNQLNNRIFTSRETPGAGRVPLYIEVFSLVREIEQNNKTVTASRFDLPVRYSEVTWFTPIRTEPKRTYDSYRTKYSPDGSHTPYLLRDLLKGSKKDKGKIEQTLRTFGQSSGLFDTVEVSILGKSKDTSPFELKVLLDGRSLKITNVGYGVSQILPLLVDIASKSRRSLFTIQQPEVHLHPKAQAAFGDFVFDSASEEEKKFIIETHSDYLIDRFRIKCNIADRKNLESKKFSSQIVFFQRKERSNILHCIPIGQDGTLSEDQPSEYGDFFLKEQMALLKI